MPFLRVTNLLNRPQVIQSPQTRFVITLGPRGTFEDVVQQATFDALQPPLQRLKMLGQLTWNATFYDADTLPPTSAAPNVGIKWQGSWNSAVSYSPNDVVQFSDINGGLPARYSSFICLVNNLGTPPLDVTGVLSTSWAYLSQRGANGSGGSAEAYTPANPSQWANPAPTSLQDAVDRLATMLSLYVVDASPIPIAGSFTWAGAQPTTDAQRLDRLATAIYTDVLDSNAIGAAGPYTWEIPAPASIGEEVSRLAYDVYLNVLDGSAIP